MVELFSRSLDNGVGSVGGLYVPTVCLFLNLVDSF